MEILDILKLLGGAGAGLAVCWKWIESLRGEIKRLHAETRRWEQKYDDAVAEQRKLLDGIVDGMKGDTPEEPTA